MLISNFTHSSFSSLKFCETSQNKHFAFSLQTKHPLLQLDLKSFVISNNKIINIELYHPSKKKEWNSFVANSNTATFLFNRDFMEYHQDRFDDYSLMIYDDEQLQAIFPANFSKNTVLKF